MDDGITSIVKVSQTNGHILKDGAVDLLWHDTIVVQALGESGGQKVHHQNWCIGVHFKAHSCQVYKKRDRDRVENIMNAREARAKFYGPRPLWGDHTHFRAIMYCHAH